MTTGGDADEAVAVLREADGDVVFGARGEHVDEALSDARDTMDAPLDAHDVAARTDSMIATTELVVPRSMPMILPINQRPLSGRGVLSPARLEFSGFWPGFVWGEPASRRMS